MNKLFGKEYDNRTMHTLYYVAGIKIQVKDKLSILNAENNFLRSIINNQLGADKISPATGEFRQWQLENLEILKDFDRICRDNDTNYWLDFGTLLGAIRHKGFIPWDDDIDVSMLKSDLDKILPILRSWYKDTDFYVREYFYPCNNFQIRIRHKKYNMGFDIFPLYEYPEQNLREEKIADIRNKIITARKKFEKKYKHKKSTETSIIQAKNDIDSFYSDILKGVPVEMPEKPSLFRGIEFHYDEDYYVMPYDEIFPLKEGEFEGYKLYIPNKSEEYLSHLWSNWHEVPKGAGSVYEHYIKNYKNLTNEGMQ